MNTVDALTLTLILAIYFEVCWKIPSKFFKDKDK